MCHMLEFPRKVDVTDSELESIPYVDRAFVHIDYTGYNLPTHMSQQE
jgi:hypothetical protein